MKIHKGRFDEVAKMLGVEINHPFNILVNINGVMRPSENNSFRITKDGLLNKYGDIDEYTLHNLLEGRAIISEILFRPKLNQQYFFVDIDGTTDTKIYKEESLDITLINMNNCFKTEQEAKEHIDDILHIYADMM